MGLLNSHPVHNAVNFCISLRSPVTESPVTCGRRKLRNRPPWVHDVVAKEYNVRLLASCHLLPAVSWYRLLNWGFLFLSPSCFSDLFFQAVDSQQSLKFLKWQICISINVSFKCGRESRHFYCSLMHKKSIGLPGKLPTSMHVDFPLHYWMQL